MIATVCSPIGFIVAPKIVASSPMAQLRIDMTISSEAEAKAAWLARLDVPAWGDAAKAMRTIAAEAATFQADLSDNKEEEAKQKWLASLDVPSWGKAAAAMEAMADKEEEAKQKWLASLDVPSWGPKGANAEEVTMEPSAPKMTEEEAKQKWLASLDVPVWGKLTEEQAKQKWLAKLDAPVWGQAAAAMVEIVAEASKMADLTEECAAGDNAACETLSKEDAAKKAWLAKLDVPSWGKMTEDQAKKKWLAKLVDAPVWQGKVAPTANTAAVPIVGVVEPSAADKEEEAKKAWLAKLDVSLF